LVSLDLLVVRSMRLQLYPEPAWRRGVHVPLGIMQEPHGFLVAKWRELHHEHGTNAAPRVDPE
jgi:hypothetical protein